MEAHRQTRRFSGGASRLALGALCLSTPATASDIRFPPYTVQITKILHSTDPAPGIPGAHAVDMGPQIDGAGKVLIDAFLEGPGITADNGRVIWYGDQNGLDIVIRAGDPAPDIPGAFIFPFWGSYLSESGLIALSTYLSGPSIVEGVNARATFVGTPGNMQKVVQAGEPAPFTEPGTVFASSSFFGVRISDNGSILLVYDLAGPAVNSTNDLALYVVGDGGELQLLMRKGMQAPGCELGVLFGHPDGIVFNDLQQIAFRGGLAGPGVISANNSGYWSGGVGSLTLIKRKAYPALKLPPGVLPAGFSFPGISGAGEVAVYSTLAGEGVDPSNDHGYWAGPPASPTLVARKGDPAPDMPDGTIITVTAAGDKTINAQGRMALQLWLGGPDITSANDRAIYFGPHEAIRLVLRKGDVLPWFGSDAVAFTLDSKYALTDVGDLVAAVQLAGTTITADNDKVVMTRRRGAWWTPLLRTGDVLDGHVVAWAGSFYQFSPIKDSTGGSDAVIQRCNDAGQVVCRPNFSDGTLGVYVSRGSAAIDQDLDGDLDLQDYAGLPACLTGPDQTVSGSPCASFDVNSDNYVDLEDFQVLQVMFTGSL